MKSLLSYEVINDWSLTLISQISASDEILWAWTTTEEVTIKIKSIHHQVNLPWLRIHILSNYCILQRGYGNTRFTTSILYMCACVSRRDQTP